MAADPEIMMVRLPKPASMTRRTSSKITTVSWKTFWVLFGSAVSLSAAVIPTLLGVTWWRTTSCIVVGSILLSVVGCKVVQRARVFSPLLDRQREKVAGLTVLAVCTFAAWSGLFAAKPDFWARWFAVLPVIGFLVYWYCRAVEYQFVTERFKPSDTHAVVRDETEIISSFKSILSKAGHPHVRVLTHEPINDDDNRLVCNQFLVQTPATGR